MSEKNIKFGDKKVDKRLFKMKGIDINKLLVSKKTPYGKESFICCIGYNDDDVIRPLCIKLPEMVAYVEHFKNNNDKDSKRMSFKVSDKKLLKNYNKIWERVTNFMKIKFDSETVHGDNDKYIWTRIKLCGDKINANFQMNHISVCH